MLLLEDGRVDPRLGVAPMPPSAPLRPESPALILYTSGSTGRPRGVIQTFRNIDANTRSIVQYLGLGADDRALLVLPLYIPVLIFGAGAVEASVNGASAEPYLLLLAATLVLSLVFAPWATSAALRISVE